jgi:hypothetical protein
MIRLIALAFALTMATSAQAMPLPRVQQPDGLITQVAQGCGPYRVRVNGVCVRRGYGYGPGYSYRYRPYGYYGRPYGRYGYYGRPYRGYWAGRAVRRGIWSGRWR